MFAAHSAVKSGNRMTRPFGCVTTSKEENFVTERSSCPTVGLDQNSVNVRLRVSNTGDLVKRPLAKVAEHENEKDHGSSEDEKNHACAEDERPAGSLKDPFHSRRLGIR